MPEHDDLTAPDQLAEEVAEEHDAPTTPMSGRERLLRALLRPARRQLVVAVLLALVGFAAIVQVRTNEVDDSFAGYREQDLIDVLNGLAGTSRRAQTENSRLERTRTDLESDTRAQQAALDQAQQEAETLSILAGLVPVTGPGIRITITEETGTVRADVLVDLVQELRNAGAEAMQFNGQVRLVAQSSFTDAVGGVVVDGTLLTAPYVVDVIGEPGTLSGGISILEGPRVTLESEGADVQIDELSSLDIESVRDPVQPEYAQPQDG